MPINCKLSLLTLRCRENHIVINSDVPVQNENRQIPKQFDKFRDTPEKNN